jgi:hypothetical protein
MLLNFKKTFWYIGTEIQYFLFTVGSIWEGPVGDATVASVSDPHRLFADPDPVFKVNVDPGPVLKTNADPCGSGS